MSDRIKGLHHITLCTGSAQGDVDLFYKTLGMSLVKRTLLYERPVANVRRRQARPRARDPGEATQHDPPTCAPLNGSAGSGKVAPVRWRHRGCARGPSG